MEKIKELIDAVTLMRKLQREYFETRDFTILNKSKSQEKFVDRLLLEIETPTLFNTES